MKPPPSYVMVFVTAPDVEVARKIAAAALQSKFAACANLVPQVESHYWWEGKLEKSAEVLIVFKTITAKVPMLQAAVKANHPYQVPEFVISNIEASPEYQQWILASVTS